MWLRDALYTCDGLSDIWYLYLPLLFKIGIGKVPYKALSNSIFLYFLKQTMVLKTYKGSP
jgi:hypothetical protein